MNNEQILQSKAATWFNNTHLQYSKCCFAVNNNSPGVIKAMQMTAIGVRSGVSDLVLICPNGKVVWCEAKTETGKQSKEQIEFQRQVESLGHIYIIFRSLEQFQEIVKTHFTCTP